MFSWTLHSGSCPVVSCCIALGQLLTEDLSNKLLVQAINGAKLMGPTGNRWSIFVQWQTSKWCNISNEAMFIHWCEWLRQGLHRPGSEHLRTGS